VTDGEDISTRDLIERLARLMDRPARFFPCPPRLLKFMAGLAGRGAEAARLCESFLLDASPARLALDWSPPQTLQEELQRTVADYLKRRQA
jgi:nucleoside-diphosphate-sugar epimerase